MLMGCTRIKKIIDPQVQGLFKTLGFTDKNENGVIDKPSLRNLWSAKENYKKEADLDNNGEISVAEAKYYLLTLKDIPVKEKEKYSLTPGEKKILGDCFSKILMQIKRAPERKFWIGPVEPSIAAEKGRQLLSLLDQVLVADLTKPTVKEIINNALLVARGLKNNPWGTEQFVEGLGERVIAAKLEKKDVKAILMLALDITKTSIYEDRIGYCLYDLLDCAIESKITGPDLREIFIKANSIANPNQEYYAYGRIYGAVFSALLKVQWYDDALVLARSIAEPDDRGDLLRKVADDMAARGQKSKILVIYKEAWDSYDKVGYLGRAELLKRELAESMARAGFISQGIEIVNKLTEIDEKYNGYCGIATILADRGSFEWSLQLVARTKGETKDYALAYISKKYTEKKDLQNALNTARSISNRYERVIAIVDIASVLIEQKNRSDACTVLCEALELSRQARHASSTGGRAGRIYDGRVDLLDEILLKIKEIDFSDAEYLLLYKKALVLANAVNVYDAIIIRSENGSVTTIKRDEDEALFQRALEVYSRLNEPAGTNQKKPDMERERYGDDKKNALISVVKDIGSTKISSTVKNELKYEALRVSDTLAGCKGYDNFGYSGYPSGAVHDDCKYITRKAIYKYLGK